jgi:hypothetical protein
VEIWFSEYEAFALLIGLLLMQHGWPQGFAVSVMRRIRPELEKEHLRILKQNPEELFDHERLRREAKEGDFAFDNTDPVLLTIISRPWSGPSDGGELVLSAVCRGVAEAMKSAGNVKGGAGAFTMFEVATPAHKLSEQLKRTEPRPRGRS